MWTHIRSRKIIILSIIIFCISEIGVYNLPRENMGL